MLVNVGTAAAKVAAEEITHAANNPNALSRKSALEGITSARLVSGEVSAATSREALPQLHRGAGS